jgi:sodium transport system permease protein
MMTMFVTGDTPAYSYFIPLYGSTMALRNILTQEITNGQLLGTIGVNLLLGMLLAAVVAKAFDNERVMFDA